jgi:hypothetical protein
MNKRSIVVAVLALLFTGFGISGTVPDQKVKAGYALLEMYIRSFQEMAAQGAGGAEVLEGHLAKMAKTLKQARDAGDIDLVFQARFARLLAMTKLFVRPDPENILQPVIERELSLFLSHVTGEDVIQGGGPAVLGQVANALAEEIINLQIYLDTKGAREALRKKLDARIMGADKED